MNNSALLTQVEAIFRDTLDDDSVSLTNETTADDVEGWDSLTHIQFVVAIEKQFKIKFSSAEILSWANVGEMLAGIERKMA